MSVPRPLAHRCAFAILCVCGWRLAAFAGESVPASTDPPSWAIALHGGAGRGPGEFTDLENRSRHATLAAALETGVEVLEAGGASLDAVERVIRATTGN